ncbi:MAG: hypothetical protein ACLFNT_14050 [Spirochaetales bacterium]
MSNKEKRDRTLADPEVPPKAARRRFSAAYKADILERADACRPGTGELGALLRREGLYSSHLSSWRAQRASQGGLEAGQRGRPRGADRQQAEELARLQRENQRLRDELAKAETIIEIQKKLSALLGRSQAEETPSNGQSS